ncbi:hypothetical protein KUTeg_020083 [Tegillarca granosa]|uniref:Uncharacterized protein n=1 Tax=Tegillarca granosa TaxID=220873 RepID=A0ABQ9E9K5_TEGGR|nr:hypothetical protein KUTeg_020083 [Tegillarca granosa]
MKHVWAELLQEKLIIRNPVFEDVVKSEVAFPYAAKDECFVDFCFEVIMQNRRRRQNPFEVAKYWCDKGQDPPGFEIDSYRIKIYDFPELEDLDSELEDDSGKQEVSVNVEDNQNTAAKTKDLEKETKKAKDIYKLLCI